MAQTGSAQREPSMEEILASIRRIIEDSDTVRPPVGSEAQFEIAPDTELSLDVPEHLEVEAFRAELDDGEKPASPMTMAEIQAAVRLEPEVDAAELPAHPAPWSAEVHPLRGDERESRDTQPAEASNFSRPATVQSEEVPVEVEPSPTFTDKVVEKVVETISSEHRPAIISDQTGRQVAAAFGELSEAFAASRKRSFDEMAEEMLRLMLQDWLDNNLPLLVERLVREEIERVARGG
jgi:cell pole-organizing protein PopZ